MLIVYIIMVASVGVILLGIISNVRLKGKLNAEREENKKTEEKIQVEIDELKPPRITRERDILKGEAYMNGKKIEGFVSISHAPPPDPVIDKLLNDVNDE